MPDASLKGRREEAFHAPHEDVAGSAMAAWRHHDDTIDIVPFLEAIWADRMKIAAWMIGAAVLTIIVTSLFMAKTFRAMAIVRPQPKATTASRIIGGFGGAPGGFSTMAGILGGGGPGAEEAQEYITILESFAFNTALMERHGIFREYSRPSDNRMLSSLENNDPRWRAYKRIKRSFECEYSTKTGNLTLYFIAASPPEAERLLGYYIDDLREKLRSREVQGAAAAIESMKEEARVTSDALLQTQLYELIAKQMQQLKLAQVEADFAFTVLEPPAAPDKPYSPRRSLDASVAALLALIVTSAIAVMREMTRQHRERRIELQRRSAFTGDRR